jgi:uncharacterized protein (DUF427 family)
MTEKRILTPGPNHPITIEPTSGRVIVTVAGKTVADTRSALTLREAAYPAVHYIPRSDVDMSLLERSDTSSYCPYKGDAAYFSVVVGDDRRPDAIWTYEDAFAAVAGIDGYLAFYPDRVDSIDVKHAT